jgi:hypothetical protein
MAFSQTPRIEGCFSTIAIVELAAQTNKIKIEKKEKCRFVKISAAVTSAPTEREKGTTSIKAGTTHPIIHVAASLGKFFLQLGSLHKFGIALTDSKQTSDIVVLPFATNWRT